MCSKAKILADKLFKCGVFTGLGLLIVVSAYRQARYESKMDKKPT